MNSNSSTPTSLSRRALLGTSTSLVAATALARNASAARGATARPVLVQVFLRGGMDGLTTVVPYGDGDLYVLRPTIAVRPPGPPQGARDLDGFFGLAPAAAPLLTPYHNGHLAIVHATGSTDATRSHFDAERRLEFGELPPGAPESGWGARYLREIVPLTSTPLRAIGVGSILPYTLFNAPQALPMLDFTVAMPGNLATAVRRRDVLLTTYSARRPAVSAAAIDTMNALGLSSVDFDNYTPENGAHYNGSLGAQLRNVAALIKADAGVEVVSIDFNGWDDHASLGPIDGQMAERLDELTRSLEAFYLDMLGHLDDYVLVCLSEFGRHARENGSAGADHGHGNAMFVMGDVNGGQVIANWPGLAPDQLDLEDLAITIDYRDILAELLVERFGVTDPSTIFPQHTFTSYGLVT
jgi:uncharacterized protein (DUF1501 family)